MGRDKSPKGFKKAKKAQPVVIKKKKKKTAMGAKWSFRPERKNIDFDTNLLTIPNLTRTFGITLINPVSQGDQGDQYVGRQLMMKNLNFRFEIFPDSASSGGNGTYFRVLLIYDRDTNGALPAVTDIMTVDDEIAYMNLNNTDRFVTIYDKMKNWQPFAENHTVMFRGNIKLHHIMKFKGATGTIANITQGGIYLLFAQGGNYDSTGLTPLLYWRSRIRFTDE